MTGHHGDHVREGKRVVRAFGLSGERKVRMLHGGAGIGRMGNCENSTPAIDRSATPFFSSILPPSFPRFPSPAPARSCSSHPSSPLPLLLSLLSRSLSLSLSFTVIGSFCSKEARIRRRGTWFVGLIQFTDATSCRFVHPFLLCPLLLVQTSRCFPPFPRSRLARVLTYERLIVCVINRHALSRDKIPKGDLWLLNDDVERIISRFSKFLLSRTEL